jgi:hypothetical protein
VREQRGSIPPYTRIFTHTVPLQNWHGKGVVEEERNQIFNSHGCLWVVRILVRIAGEG